MQEKLARILIDSAVDRWIIGLRNDTGRSARKLTELGEQMSRSTRQHWFFEKAQEMLSHEDNGYYELAHRLANDVDRMTLRTFGVDFGYNSLTRGADAIHARQSQKGESIPWTLVLEVTDGSAQDGFALQRRVLQEGEALGLHTYFIDATACMEELETLCSLLSTCRDDCFFLFCEPRAALAFKQPETAHNIMFLLDAAGADFSGACALLRGAQCLWGMYLRYDEKTADAIIGGEYSSIAEDSGCAAFFLMPEDSCSEATSARVLAYADKQRREDCYGYFVSECRSDIRFIDKSITGSSRYLKLRSDGTVLCETAQGARELSLGDSSLADLAQKTAS